MQSEDLFTEQRILKADKAVVHRTHARQVRYDWLSACEEERALTAGIMEEVLSPLNLVRSYRKVVSNAGSAGVDGMTVKELGKWLRGNFMKLQEELINGKYIPAPVRNVTIPKPKGGHRQLGIPTVIDRLVQQAIHQSLSPRYEKVFSEYSYGFRPCKSAHDALEKASQYVAEGYRYVVDLDLEKFFDKVNHDRLMWLLGTRIGDSRLLKLIGKYLHGGVLKDGLIEQRSEGTPQGSPLSPLLSNIVLDELNKELERRGHRYVRYADDVKIFVKSENSAKRTKDNITKFIEKQLKLKVNGDKSRICLSYELNFLGHSILYGGKLALSKESEARLKDKIRTLTSRRRSVKFEVLLKQLHTTLQGWLLYFRKAHMKSKLVNLDSWVRRKLRCYRLKQCKRTIGIVRFFRSLKVEEKLSWKTALSGKGWWRISNCPAVNIGRNNNWFYHQGYFSLALNYEKFKRY